MIYEVKKRERLYSIVYAHYGSVRYCHFPDIMPFEEVLKANLKANPNFSVILKPGDTVVLPDIKVAAPLEETKALYYKAKDGERLDSIVYACYSSLLPFEKVLGENLKENPDFPVILKAGDDVMLPDIKIEPPTEEAKALWD